MKKFRGIGLYGPGYSRNATGAKKRTFLWSRRFKARPKLSFLKRRKK